MGLMHVRMAEIQTIKLSSMTGGVEVSVLLSPAYGTVDDYVVIGKHGKAVGGGMVFVDVIKYTDHVGIIPDIDAEIVEVTVGPRTT